MVPIPSCKEPNGGWSRAQQLAMINSALEVSPGCQVDTVEELTHVQIDHFVEVDFEGVVQITNAVGGVPVCVDAPVHDPDSGLNLPKGTTLVKGQQALEFLRTRHGFVTGSDVYRTQVQHQYLSSLIRQLREEGNLSDTGTLLHIASVATSSLTVDNGLHGLTKLMGLVDILKQVPTDRITFLTMQTLPWPQDPEARLEPDPQPDDQLFALINSDTPASKGTSSKPSPSPTATTSVAAAAPASVGPVVVANGTDTSGRAGTVAGVLGSDGFAHVSAVNYTNQTQGKTVVYYASGEQAAAEAVATALRLPASAVKPGSTAGGQVELVIGGDFTNGSVYVPTTQIPSALASNAVAENAADTNECARSADS
jgi:LCP family protein required for cell wall assembly